MWPRALKREIDVYDRRLEAISAAAELGSFSRAAAKLRVSTPALVKQVSGFEAEFGVTLFERSHSGVKVTPAGALLVDDARSIMRQSEDALRRARRAAGDGGAVRLGVSMMCPGRQTLSMWTGVHELEPSLRFEIVPVSDLYDERESVMRSLGREVDVVQSSFSTPRWGDVCQKLRIVNVPFYIDVPRTSPLARKTRITVADLEGMRLRVLRHGNDAMDSLRIDLRFAILYCQRSLFCDLRLFPLLGARFAFHCISDAPVYFSAVFGKPVTGLFLLFSAVCSARNIY